MQPNIHFFTTPHVVSSPGALGEHLGSICQSFSVQKALIITDRGIVDLGYAQKAVQALNQYGMQAQIFDKVVADPPTSVVNEALALAKREQSDIIIGLGGGSSIDTAKIISLYQNDFSDVEEIIGKDITSFIKTPLIAIPTTAGTGSEVTFVSVLTAKDGSKSAIYSPKILPDVAILDAELTIKLPQRITSASALDAMVHAIEAYTSKTKKNAISDALAIQGLKLLWDNYPTVLNDSANVRARADMLLGSTLAGMAFVNSSVAAVHGLSYPLGIKFHIPHGHANALVMIPVFRFNMPEAINLYSELAHAVMPEECTGLSSSESAEKMFDRLETYFANSGLETKLAQLGVTEEDIPILANDMVTNYSRLISTNPKHMELADVINLYRQAWV